MEHTLRNLPELHHYLTHSIKIENIYGDYFLASLVQDAVVQMFTENDVAHVIECLPQICEQALKAVHQLVVVNHFVVRETIRGVLHGVVSLGGDAKTVTTVALSAIRSLVVEGKENDYSAMAKGISRTCVDLGIADVSIGNEASA